MKPLALPNPEKMSALTAAILLTYTMARFITLPGRTFTVQAPGLLVELNLNLNTVIALLVAGITAAGADWLLREHPALHNRGTVEHLAVPALAAVVLGTTLNRLALGGAWWVILGLGGALVALVLLAEYIAVDPSDPRYGVATAGLTALSLAIFLVLCANIRVSGSRLIWVLPAIAGAAGLICYRTLYLKLLLSSQLEPDSQTAAFYASLTTTIVLGQITTTLHYTPLQPLAFSLVILGAAYGLTVLFGNLANEQKQGRAIYGEPLLVSAVFVVLALLLNR